MRFLACLACLICVSPAIAAPPLVERGTFRFRPLADQKDIPERYRLKQRDFTYEMDRKTTLPVTGVGIFRLRFPTALRSSEPENNTVHAEYYRPKGRGPFPAVIILDVTAGNQMLSRHMGAYLAGEGVAGLFVQMAYYGPRRPPGSERRLLSPNVPHTVRAVTQTVLDLRAASAWLGSREEVDSDKIGIVGTSLGSFLSALTGQMEPRLGRVVVLLGGGGFIDGYADHPQAAPWLRLYESLGGKRENLKKAIEPIDPITRADLLKERKLLIIAASRDDVVPPSMSRALWAASGKQRIIWYDTTHVGAGSYIAEAMEHILGHVKGEEPAKRP